MHQKRQAVHVDSLDARSGGVERLRASVGRDPPAVKGSPPSWVHRAIVEEAVWPTDGPDGGPSKRPGGKWLRPGEESVVGRGVKVRAGVGACSHHGMRQHVSHAVGEASQSQISLLGLDSLLGFWLERLASVIHRGCKL